jgi:hypothetical protein
MNIEAWFVVVETIPPTASCVEPPADADLVSAARRRRKTPLGVLTDRDRDLRPRARLDPEALTVGAVRRSARSTCRSLASRSRSS